MTRQEAITTLKEFQKWRRGGELDQPNHKQIGLAIDKAIQHMTKRHHHSKLTYEQENEIYQHYLKNGNTLRFYSEQYDISIYNVKQILDRKLKKGAD